MKFDPAAFRRVTLADHDVLTARLIPSEDQSCEFNFANLYIWGFVYLSAWQIYNDQLYLYMMDESGIKTGLMFACPCQNQHKMPKPEELATICDAMKEAGFNPFFQHICQCYVDHYPELERYFTMEQMPADFAEYIYRVDSLVDLKGSKLAKKRNLIAQFKREYPDCYTRAITPEDIPIVLKLAEEWRLGHPTPNAPHVLQEVEALHHLTDGYSAMDIEGLIGFAGGRPISFEMCSRISDTVYTEHFEKALHEYKGAPQYINHEMAKVLQNKCVYLNREQDLGSPGLRQAKLSYDPELLLQNYRLVRKS